ncbi:MAG TPA: transposase [Clostridia bacterium]|jgi:putative transposase|nr:transposase [Clostridia bacterium]HPY97919.1 transposase [Clostridia bacterium]HQC67968.1 transposase [Clostridia bacterium]
MPVNEVINISHKILLIPNNKAITHFRKAFGCSRLAYNWGLNKWQEYYKQGIKKTHLELKKEFNSIKKEEFPFVYEVSKYATQQPFLHLNAAFKKFFRDLEKGKISYPKFKKKSKNSGSYYIGGDHVVIKDEKYLKIPNLGLVKMREKLRFDGKINSVTISQNGDKFYASFSMQITKQAYADTHKKPKRNNIALGIDVGLNSFLSLSNGLEVKAPKPLKKLERTLIRRSRQLNRKQHAKTKQEALDGVESSKNFIKASRKLNKLYSRITNIRKDYLHKLTSSLVANADYFCLEDLNVQGMMQNHRLAKSLSDVSFYEFKRQLEYKAAYNDKQIIQVDRFYPSSKMCSKCGNIKTDLSLKDRVYYCQTCGTIIDRDYNASLNMLSHLQKAIGQVRPEFTLADLTALQLDLAINQIVTNKVEAGIQQKYCA